MAQANLNPECLLDFTQPSAVHQNTTTCSPTYPQWGGQAIHNAVHVSVHLGEVKTASDSVGSW